MPKISVIVPIYKVEKYLNRCVDSILNQTFADFECILVDDGSPDNCGKICDEYAENDKRIRVIHKENGGLSDARNAGIEIAQGEYISFIDSDDWIHPQMLEILYDAAVKNGVTLSACDWYVAETEVDFKSIENPKVEICNAIDNFLSTNDVAVMSWNKLYHRSLFDDIRFPKGHYHEDEFILLKYLYKARNVALCRVKLYVYFHNSKSITNDSYSLKRLDAISALKAQYKFFKKKKIEKGVIFSIRRIISNCTVHLELIDSSELCDSDYKRAKKVIMRDFRKYLIIGCLSGRIRKEDHYHNLEIAFPTFMKYYWLLMVLKKKIL